MKDKKIKAVGLRDLQYWGCQGCVLAMAAAMLTRVAHAFPPAPPHLVTGMLRTEMGDPLNTTNAVVILETLTGVRVRASVVPNLSPGRNYRIEVPMDAGTTADNYRSSALRAATSFRMKVQLGAVTYLPIETAVKTASLGKPTQATSMDLTLGEDSDGDGLPDAWERAIMATLGMAGTIKDLRPGDDSDGDGISNLNEYRAGTYAFDPADGFQLDPVAKSGDAMTLEWVAVPGRRYGLQGSGDLATWKPLPFRIAGSAQGAPASTEIVASSTRILRVEVPTSESAGAVFFKATVQ